MEPILIGAALGAGVGGATAGIRGGDPLQGALIGGLTGAAGGGLTGGLGSVGATAQAGANTTAQAGAFGLPSTVGASLVESGASGLMGDVLEQAALSGLPYSASPFAAGAQHFMRNPGTTMSALGGMMPSGGNLGSMAAIQGMGGAQQSPQPQLQAAPIRPGQIPQMSPMDEMMRLQMMAAQRPRRPISLL
jgi:hypothetical protein